MTQVQRKDGTLSPDIRSELGQRTARLHCVITPLSIPLYPSFNRRRLVNILAFTSRTYTVIIDLHVAEICPAALHLHELLIESPYQIITITPSSLVYP